jgi:hypothetical protein
LSAHQVAVQKKTLHALKLALRVSCAGNTEQQREADNRGSDYGPPLPFTTSVATLVEPTTGQPNSSRIMISS